MNETIIYAIILLAAIGLIAAVVLYYVAQKFRVVEDPRIDLIADKLPGANCGGCGRAGCRDFAEFIINAGGETSATCPVCDGASWGEIMEILGKVAEKKEPKIAVVRCNGGAKNSIKKVDLEGFPSCAYANGLFAGESGCPNSCLGLGDCERVCNFDAIFVNKETQLPDVIAKKCTSCGACVTICPRNIIELRYQRPDTARVTISCINTQKGIFATKVCKVSCIACGKCVKTCPEEAICLANNIAYIDYEKCTSCGACVDVCPRNTIVMEINNPNFIPPSIIAKAEKEVAKVVETKVEVETVVEVKAEVVEAEKEAETIAEVKEVVEAIAIVEAAAIVGAAASSDAVAAVETEAITKAAAEILEAVEEMPIEEIDDSYCDRDLEEESSDNLLVK